MFPNVHLMIVAIMASILGMSCGLGVLAVLRVNHDPFVRLSNAASQLPLAFSYATPITFRDPVGKDAAVQDSVAAPFGARFEVNLPQSIGPAPQPVPSVAPTVATTPDGLSHDAAVDAPQSISAVSSPAPPASDAATEPVQLISAVEAEPAAASSPAPPPPEPPQSLSLFCRRFGALVPPPVGFVAFDRADQAGARPPFRQNRQKLRRALGDPVTPMRD